MRLIMPHMILLYMISKLDVSNLYKIVLRERFKIHWVSMFLQQMPEHSISKGCYKLGCLPSQTLMQIRWCAEINFMTYISSLAIWHIISEIESIFFVDLKFGLCNITENALSFRINWFCWCRQKSIVTSAAPQHQ